jgi:hypothetical protein
MSTTYGIYVIQLDRECWFIELQDALGAELEAVGLQHSLTVQVSEEPFSPDIPSVAVYLGDASAAADPNIAAKAQQVLQDGVVVIPVIEDLGSFTSLVPECLHAINAFAWDGLEPAERLARLLLEELGIEDSQRSVFISHKREDGLGIAEQLHDRLSHQRFLPFIDRFALQPGEPVQERIADALEDHAFLLLVETPEAHKSRWVFDEVEYALTHAMGIMILSWPNDPTPVPGSRRMGRFALTDKDLASDPHGFELLTETALERVVASVEAAHAEGIVRRRQMLTRSVEESARGAGCSCVPQPSWRTLVERAGVVTIVGVTPRLPSAIDLQQLDEARSSHGADSQALLVHSARVLRPALRQHLGWVAGERELTLGPENAVGAHWV